ncbi:MAG: ATP-dependent protease ATPase subunit HslU [Fimbriimonadaceae bacterium]|nr:ATP-dependent protease ATPase subunit HslU [Fimbriimonadaceae bacterium]
MSQVPIETLTPRQIVAELDRYIIGQSAAKKAVAIALRNRFRRQQLPPAERDDINPKNILMIGPTGVGKTEIARRLAQLARAPFIKVEATKFTEVGYVGRDVDSMVRDLAANAVRLVEAEKVAAVQEQAREAAFDTLVNLLDENKTVYRDELAGFNPLFRQAIEMYQGTSEPQTTPEEYASVDAPGMTEEEHQAYRKQLREEIVSGLHDEKTVEVEVEEAEGNKFLQVFTPGGMEEMGLDMANLMGGGGTRHVYRQVSVKDAKEILTQNEANRRIDRGSITQEAVYRTEQSGIIFLDEIDKVAMKGGGAGPEVSREGVQRDLLPIIEGSTVQSKFGPIKTDHILFIAAGAFHESKPSDLIPELQGRLPIRVELESLSEDDFRRILSEPQNALTRQYEKLLAVEGVTVTFTSDALDEVAHMATEVNQKIENTGARRLATMLEKVLEDILFEAPEIDQKEIKIDTAFVRDKLGNLVRDAKKSRALI